MSRPKSDIKRERLSTNMIEPLMKLIKIRASLLGETPNIFVESALESTLEIIKNAKRIDIYGLIAHPVKAKRIQISLMLKKDVADQVRALSKTSGVPFVEIMEKAILTQLHLEMNKIRAGEASALDCRVYWEAYTEFKNTELEISNGLLSDYNKLLSAIKAQDKKMQ